MRCIGALIGYRIARANFLRRLGLSGGDEFAAPRGVVFADEGIDGDHGLVRVAKVTAAVGVGELHALDHPVEVGGAVVSIGFQRVGLEDVEHLQNMNAAGGGRCCRDNLEVAEGASDWRALQHAVVGQILFGDESVVSRHVAGDQCGGLAGIKAVGAFVTNTRQRARQIGLLKQRAGGGCGVTTLQVDALGFLVFGEALSPGTEAHVQSQRRIETLLGEINGRLYDLLQRELAVALLRMNKARYGARYTCGLMGEVGFGLIDRAVFLEKHVAGRCRRCGFAVVDKNLLVGFSEVNQHKAAAANVPCPRKCHRQCKPGCYGRIDGIATLLQHVEADLTCQFLRAHDHTRAAIGGQIAVLVIDDGRVGRGHGGQRALRQRLRYRRQHAQHRHRDRRKT